MVHISEVARKSTGTQVVLALICATISEVQKYDEKGGVPEDTLLESILEAVGPSKLTMVSGVVDGLVESQMLSKDNDFNITTTLKGRQFMCSNSGIIG